MLKLIGFIVGSAVLVYVSRASLRAPRSHGFYRFFAWEFMWGLFLLNVDGWFRDPFSAPQLVSWLCLGVSGFLVVHGVYLLRRLGRPDAQRADTPMIGFEKTTTLVTDGAYRYIRHPLYSSLFFLTWGIFFKNPAWLGGGLAAAATLLLVMTAKADEAECVRFFGSVYQAYMQRTKMFVPFLF
jgi:protein-S-isoprenylcysteine O-methyltransferase Ste14